MKSIAGLAIVLMAAFWFGSAYFVAIATMLAPLFKVLGH